MCNSLTEWDKPLIFWFSVFKTAVWTESFRKLNFSLSFLKVVSSDTNAGAFKLSSNDTLDPLIPFEMTVPKTKKNKIY